MTGFIPTLRQPWWDWDGKKASMLHSTRALGHGLRNKSGIKESLYSESGQQSLTKQAGDHHMPWTTVHEWLL